MIALLLVLAWNSIVLAQTTNEPAQPDSDFVRKLKSVPGVVKVVPARFDRSLFKEGYEATFEQPLDHQQPNGEKFRQRVFISHAAYDKTVLLGTEGYASRGTSGNELQRILAGNQVVVEHRYFGQSVPSPVRWEHLTIRQSADDLHAIVTALKTLYTGPWGGIL